MTDCHRCEGSGVLPGATLVPQGLFSEAEMATRRCDACDGSGDAPSELETLTDLDDNEEAEDPRVSDPDFDGWARRWRDQ